jgi:hypothetical protein
MRDNKFLIAAAVALMAMVILLVILMIPWGGTVQDPAEGGFSPFGETGEVRDISLDTIVAEVPVGDLSFGEQEYENEAPPLRVLSNVPVIGSALYMGEIGTRTEQFARYIERGTGRILDTPLRVVEQPLSLIETSLSRIGRALWSTDAEMLIIQRYGIDAVDMSNYIARLITPNNQTQPVTEGDVTVDNDSTIQTTGKQEMKLDGRLLSSNIADLAVSPGGDSVFFLERTEAGVTGYLESADMGVRRSIWGSPLRSLTVSWNAPDTIVIYPNPSSIAHGVVWILNPSTGASEVVLAKQLALAAQTNRSGSSLLYSFQESAGSVRSLRLLDIASAEVRRAPITTIVEKCTWGTVDADNLYCAVPSNLNTKDYLENWYMGTVESKDVIMRWNIRTGAIDTILDPEQLTKRTFDIVDMVISPQEDFIVFRTKNNSILWSARIPGYLQPQKEPREQETESL